MIFTMNRSDLQSAISAPSRIASKSLVINTACVLVTASTDHVTFEATDQTESARCTQAALVDEQGSILIPANSLASIIKTLPDEAVSVSSGDGSVRIVCGRASFDLPALCPDDFPRFPTVDSADSVSMPFDLFASMAKAACSFAAKKDGGREFAKGVHVVYDGLRLKMDATDTYHIIRIVDQSDDVNGSGGFSATIPASFLGSAASAKFASDAVLSASDNQIQIACGNTTLITRAINDNFPSIDAFFDFEVNARADFARDDLYGTIKRAVAVSPSDPVSIKIQDGSIDVSLSSQDKGAMHESIDVTTDGMCTALANPSFLLDSLAAIDSERASLVMDNPINPFAIKNDTTACVIMPVRRS